MVKRIALILGCLILVVSGMIICGVPNPALGSDPGADLVLGYWLTRDEETDKPKSIIEFYKTGEEYRGRIVWLREPTYEDGTPKRDRNNPDEELRHRKLMGMDIAWGFHYEGDKEWKGGKIYDPENGKTYSCKLSMNRTDRLKVRGYIGISLIGRTQIWERKKTLPPDSLD